MHLWQVVVILAPLPKAVQHGLTSFRNAFNVPQVSKASYLRREQL